MHRLPRLLVLLAVAAAAFPAASPSGSDGSFAFTLAKPGRTSAGVYAADGCLVRTLWGNVDRAAGQHRESWDGKDDFGGDLPPGAYTVKVLSSNVTYHWDGLIGNTSSSSTGPGIHHGYDTMQAMAIVGGTAYVAIGYDEAAGTKIKFETAHPQTKTGWILGSGQGTSQQTTRVCADETRVFWGEHDPYNLAHWWVHATAVAGDASVPLAHGAAFTPTHSISYPSVIDLSESADGAISGLAVQAKGRLLFVAHAALNAIHVFDKNTGELLQRASMPAPAAVAVDGDDAVWVVGNGTVARHHVGGDGTIGPATLTLAGLVRPLAVQVSPDRASVLVVDGGTAQQVKSFATRDGAARWTLGREGGYSADATVFDDKFMFDEQRAFIAFQPDGSFWLSDSGNWRVQRFGADRAWKDTIMYVPVNYCISVDRAKPTRVFAQFLEFAVDYSKPLAPNNGSWRLVRNWSANAPADNHAFGTLAHTATLGNGRTYSTVMHGNGPVEFVELVEGSVMRLTGIRLAFEYTLMPDGSLAGQTQGVDGQQQTWSRRPLTGFDAAGNPQWGDEQVVERTPVIGERDPVWRGNGMEYRPGEATSTGVYADFLGANRWSGYHVGGVKNGKWVFRTAVSTHRSYAGPFPTNGDFDIGNGVSDFAGSNAIAFDKFIFWGYHGEFWRSGQVNMWHQLNDDGLIIGQFGTSSGSYREGYPEMAGNSFCAHVVKVGANLYLYHNDEFYHSGVHRWTISGLDTIAEQTVALARPTAYVAPVVPGDLMAGLPFDATLVDGTAGWHRSPAVDDAAPQTWSVRTSHATYDQRGGRDLFATWGAGRGATALSRDLDLPKTVDAWRISAEISYAGSQPNFHTSGGGAFVEVVDAAGKVIARLTWNTDYSTFRGMFGNGVAIAVSPGTAGFDDGTPWTQQPIEIAWVDGKVAFTYAAYPTVTADVAEPGADAAHPALLRLRFDNDTPAYGKSVDLAHVRLSTGAAARSTAAPKPAAAKPAAAKR